jgi:hypothetical protein
LAENSSQEFLRYLAASLRRMLAVREHFRFDGGDQSGFPGG